MGLILALAFGGLNAEASRRLRVQEEFALASRELAQAQVNYKMQVQEWKDMLLRAGDAGLYEKHKGLFEQRERACAQALEQALRLASGPLLWDNFTDLDIFEIKQLQEEHKALGKGYRDALVGLDRSNRLSAFEVDKRVMGIDRPLMGLMEKVAGRLAQKAQALGKAQSDWAQKRAWGLAGADLALTAGLLWLLGRKRKALDKALDDPLGDLVGRARLAQSAFRNGPDPAFALDRDGKVAHWSEACERLSGFGQAELAGGSKHGVALGAQEGIWLADAVLEAAKRALARSGDPKMRIDAFGEELSALDLGSVLAGPWEAQGELVSGRGKETWRAKALVEGGYLKGCLCWLEKPADDSASGAVR